MAQVLMVVADFVLAVNELNDAGVHRVKFIDTAAGLQAPAPMTADVGSEMEALDVVKYWLMLDTEHDEEARQWLVRKFGAKAMEGYMPSPPLGVQVIAGAGRTEG